MAQNNILNFTIFQEPTGKKAVLHTKTGITYHSKEQKFNESTLISELIKYRPPEPITDPIQLHVKLYFAIPKSKSQWWQEAADKGYILHVKKPDDDNCRKQIADCLEKLQFIKNDSQIYCGKTFKRYSTKPRWEIKIEITPQITRQEWTIIKKRLS